MVIGFSVNVSFTWNTALFEPRVSIGYELAMIMPKYLGPVPQKPINANLRLKINQAVYFSTPKCCSTQIFGRTLHEKTSILKNKNKQKKLLPKSWKRETKVYANPGLS